MESIHESERSFTTLILGGGPETLILLLEALKHSKIHDFLKKDGLAVIEKSTSFGAGYMDNFVVKSTKSSALSFIKLLLRHPEADEQNKKLMEMIEKGKIDDSIAMIVSTIKNIANFPKIYEYCSPMFRELLETNVFARIMQDNVNPSLMLETGYFLKLLGNSFLNHLKVIKNAEIFIPRREVVSLRLLIDGMILVTSRIIEDSETKKAALPGVKNVERFESYRTKRVILTSPGGPRVQLPQNILPLDKLIDADGFLQESGYIRVYSSLTKQSKKKVLILGANPTAFACISLLLKGPEQSDCYEESVNRNGILLSKRQKVFEREKVTVNDLSTQSDVLSNSSRLSASSKRSTTGLTPAEVNTPPKKKCHGNHHHHHREHDSPQPKNENLEEAKFQQFLKFTKYGSIKGNEYNLYKKYPKPLIFDDDNIVLAYKDTPRIYYTSSQEAIKSGSKMNPKDSASTGEVNMLDGLAGEARKLYEDIQARNEKRVQLLQASSTSELKDLINEANIIIDCQGFDPELVLIKDLNGQPLKIRKGPNGGYLVDGNGRIVSEKGVIKGIYALGLGFEKEEGDRGRVMDPYTRFSKYDNYEHLQKAIFKDSLLESLVQDFKNVEDNEEHYEILTKEKSADPFKIEEKKSTKFGLENMESVIIESEMPMYTTLRMFEKMNFDKTKEKHGHKH